ncbi:MAG: hypothetical protein HZB26_14885 [Candidatus Hydrogenedentes bacterium]|nr:hypothetical protein [Candidatus Hydrogenedentota bacterium]
MYGYRCLWIALLACGASAWAQLSAPGGFAPPPASKDALDAALNPIPKDTVAQYLTAVSPARVFRAYQGKNAALKSQNADAGKKIRIGANFPVDLPAATLFTDAITDGGYTVYLGGITSADALGLRLRVDLSELTDADEAWVIDPTAPRAFGPFKRRQGATKGRWLSSVEGDTAVVMVRTTAAHLPAVRVVGVSHFYVGLAEALKVLSCNVNVACETHAFLRDHVSTSVGRLAISSGDTTSLCSGSLVNNPDTAQFEPYFITAHHCIGTVSEAEDSEVIWDYRSATCSPDTVPSVSSLPRSEGEALLATDGTLDGTLIELESVPSGSLGRYYLGWDLRAPVINEDIIGLHHPLATAMRVNHGRVTAINQTIQTGVLTSYHKQTRVVWDEGVTEAGSSGSCLLFDDGSYALTGMLSNGATHTCGADRSGNIDDFTSFRDFYSEISGFLSGTNPPDPIEDTPPGLCPAKAAFENDPEILEKLRALRDQGLLPTALGKQLTAVYYKAAPYLAELVQKSPEARGVFVLTASPFVSIGGAILEQTRHAAINH